MVLWHLHALIKTLTLWHEQCRSLWKRFIGRATYIEISCQLSERFGFSKYQPSIKFIAVAEISLAHCFVWLRFWCLERKKWGKAAVLISLLEYATFIWMLNAFTDLKLRILHLLTGFSCHWYSSGRSKDSKNVHLLVYVDTDLSLRIEMQRKCGNFPSIQPRTSILDFVSPIMHTDDHN